jgi:hypothetical protein
VTARHLELLVEEASMEAFLRELLPRVLPDACSFEVHPFQGKQDLLRELPRRLRGYGRWLPEDWRIVVLVDRDDQECAVLKGELEAAAAGAGLRTPCGAASGAWQVVNRIAVEELEAWYFGDWKSVRAEYPRLPKSVSARRGLRDPDGIAGGTWEAFERILKQSGYFTSGLRKVEAARAIGARFDAGQCSSKSFRVFHTAILEATTS